MANGERMRAFVDFGSTCNLMRLSEARKLGKPIDTTCNTCIKGYGLGMVKAHGKLTLDLEVNTIRKHVDVLVVADNMQDTPLLIGQPFTEQPDILVIKTNETLTFSKLEAEPSNIASRYQRKCSFGLWIPQLSLQIMLAIFLFSSTVLTRGTYLWILP